MNAMITEFVIHKLPDWVGITYKGKVICVYENENLESAKQLIKLIGTKVGAEYSAVFPTKSQAVFILGEDSFKLIVFGFCVTGHARTVRENLHLFIDSITEVVK